MFPPSWFRRDELIKNEIVLCGLTNDKYTHIDQIISL